MKFLTTVAATLTVCAAAPASFAMESESMDSAELVAVPDRPTFTTSAVTVPAGHAQLEGGLEFNSTDGESALGIPVFARLGIADSFELRAGLPAPNIGFGADGDTDLGALQLGGKVAGDLSDSFSLGVMPFFDIASNSADSTIFAQSALGSFLLWGYQIGDLGLGGNLGVTVGPGATDASGPREFFYSASLAASYAFGDFSVTADGFTVIGEVADSDVGAHLALGYAVCDTIVLDLYGGSGFTGSLPDYWFGLGATVAK